MTPEQTLAETLAKADRRGQPMSAERLQEAAKYWAAPHWQEVINKRAPIDLRGDQVIDFEALLAAVGRLLEPPEAVIEAVARLLADRDTVLIEDAPEVYLPLAEAVVRTVTKVLIGGEE